MFASVIACSARVRTLTQWINSLGYSQGSTDGRITDLQMIPRYRKRGGCAKLFPLGPRWGWSPSLWTHAPWWWCSSVWVIGCSICPRTLDSIFGLGWIANCIFCAKIRPKFLEGFSYSSWVHESAPKAPRFIAAMHNRVLSGACVSRGSNMQWTATTLGWLDANVVVAWAPEGPWKKMRRSCLGAWRKSFIEVNRWLENAFGSEFRSHIFRVAKATLDCFLWAHWHPQGMFRVLVADFLSLSLTLQLLWSRTS